MRNTSPVPGGMRRNWRKTRKWKEIQKEGERTCKMVK
jgi:hypothetical protein